MTLAAAGLVILCALLGLCGPRGVAVAVLMLGVVFAAAVAGRVGLVAAF